MHDLQATITERRATGKAARKRAPRSTHAQWDEARRGHDALATITAQNEIRDPDLIPIRHGRMAASPWTYFRGAAAVMAADLGSCPHTRLDVQLCGDAHVLNFGLWATPERNLLFDLRDFDETLPGPFEWDLKRLVASCAVAGRTNGLDEAARARLVREVVETYRGSVQQFAQMARLDVWYAILTAQDIEAHWTAGADKKHRKAFRKHVAKSVMRTSERALQKLTTTDADGRIRFNSKPPFLEPFEQVVPADEREEIVQAALVSLVDYRRTLLSDRRVLFSGYRVVDVARKVVGVGSVGTRCWVVLLMADKDESDVLMLQFKEAQASALEPYLGSSRVPSHGQRVVEGQRLMQTVSDILLGWTQLQVRGQQVDFYVRQMWDWKESVDVASMDEATLDVYARECGWTLARAHSRSGDRVALAAYLGSGDALDNAMVQFAEAYAEQNAKDFAALQEAASAGRIEVAASGW